MSEADSINFLGAQMEQVQKCVADLPSTSPSLRRVKATVLNGSNLMGKDLRFRVWKRLTANPYYVIKFKGVEYACPHRTKTLNPQWDERPFSLGPIARTEPELLEICVFDYNKRSKDKFMGAVQVSGSHLYNLDKGKHTYRFQLEQSEKEAYKTEASGEISVRFIVEVLSHAMTLLICLIFSLF